ncbi:MAG TPA: hypothetical protein ENK28_12990, partial [Aliiroseovarius sp.]|nr:hypothetical protein [Aliiroseovarius sp.]
MRRFFALVLFTAFVSGTSVVAKSSENALMVQAIQAWEQAQSQTGSGAQAMRQRLQALTLAQDAIETLLSDHADSDVALQVILGQANLPFSRAALKTEISELEATLSELAESEKAAQILNRALRLQIDARAAPADNWFQALVRYAMLREAAQWQQKLRQTLPDQPAMPADAAAGQAAELAEAAAGVAELCAELPPDLCIFNRARRIIRTYQDTSDKIKDLVRLAAKLREARYSEAARQVIDEALSTHENAARKYEYSIGIIAAEYARQGQYGEVRVLRDRFTDPAAIARFEKFIAIATVKNPQNFDEAMFMAATISSE